MEQDRLLAESVESELESRGFSVVALPPDQVERVPSVRAAGRRICRERGWRVRTRTMPHSDGSVEIHVIVTQADELHERLWDAKRAKAMRSAINRI